MPATLTTRLVPALFEAAVALRGLTITGLLSDAERKVLERARKRGFLTHHQADQLACRVLNVHPTQIWGDAWYDEPTKACDACWGWGTIDFGDGPETCGCEEE